MAQTQIHTSTSMPYSGIVMMNTPHGLDKKDPVNKLTAETMKRSTAKEAEMIRNIVNYREYPKDTFKYVRERHGSEETHRNFTDDPQTQRMVKTYGEKLLEIRDDIYNQSREGYQRNSLYITEPSWIENEADRRLWKETEDIYRRSYQGYKYSYGHDTPLNDKFWNDFLNNYNHIAGQYSEHYKKLSAQTPYVQREIPNPTGPKMRLTVRPREKKPTGPSLSEKMAAAATAAYYLKKSEALELEEIKEEIRRRPKTPFNPWTPSPEPQAQPPPQPPPQPEKQPNPTLVFNPGQAKKHLEEEHKRLSSITFKTKDDIRKLGGLETTYKKATNMEFGRDRIIAAPSKNELETREKRLEEWHKTERHSQKDIDLHERDLLAPFTQAEHLLDVSAEAPDRQKRDFVNQYRKSVEDYYNDFGKYPPNMNRDVFSYVRKQLRGERHHLWKDTYVFSNKAKKSDLPAAPVIKIRKNHKLNLRTKNDTTSKITNPEFIKAQEEAEKARYASVRGLSPDIKNIGDYIGFKFDAAMKNPEKAIIPETPPAFLQVPSNWGETAMKALKEAQGKKGKSVKLIGRYKEVDEHPNPEGRKRKAVGPVPQSGGEFVVPLPSKKKHVKSAEDFFKTKKQPTKQEIEKTKQIRFNAMVKKRQHQAQQKIEAAPVRTPQTAPKKPKAATPKPTPKAKAKAKRSKQQLQK